jgi:anti-sigma regulatory factor (Ser/Thr protein kinase)
MSRVLVIQSDSPVTKEIGDALASWNFPMEYAAGHVDALHRLRMMAFGVVVTSPESTVEEDLALLREMREIRPGVKTIVLARHSTPAEVIAALRAKVFSCFTPPFDTQEIANLACAAASDSELWRDDIQVLSARPGWVAIRVNCRLLTAERVIQFAKELNSQLPEEARAEIIQAFREILLNAMEHGAAFNPEQVVEIIVVRTARSMVIYVRDPGAGFRRESLDHAAIANPHDPAGHIALREAEGMRPGGYGMLLAAGTVDELIYNEIGNEVLLIKYLDPAPATTGS